MLGKPQWRTEDYAGFALDGYRGNSLVFAAVMYKIRALTAAPLRAYKGDPENPELLDADDPLAMLVARPNPHQSWTSFQSYATLYLNLGGSCYIYLDRDNKPDGPVVGMYPLRTDHVNIVAGKVKGQHTVKGYVYKPDGVRQGKTYLPEDIMHIKIPNALDSMGALGQGQAPLDAASKSLDVDQEVTSFLKLFFEHGMMPPMAFKFDMTIDETTAAEAKERYKEIYGGTEGMLEPLILDSRGEIEKLGYSFEELGFEHIDNRNESRVLMPFGVPPILLGTRFGMERATDTNYKNARKQFWQDTMIPELHWFWSEYRYYLQGEGDEFVAFDLSKVPALEPDVDALTTAAYKLWEMGAPAETAVATVGLKVKGDWPGADVSYLSMGAWPVGATTGTGESEEGQPEATDENREKSGFSPEQKQAHRKAVDIIATSWQDQFAAMAAQLFQKDLEAVLAIIRGKKQADPDWNGYMEDIDGYYFQESKQLWNDGFEPLLLGVAVDQGERWAATLGAGQLDPRQIMGSEWFMEYTLKFSDPITTTSRDHLAQVLAQASDDGWSIPRTQDAIELTFEQWMRGEIDPKDLEFVLARFPAHRTELIARTETIRASNGSSFNLFKQWRVPHHEWVATPDLRVRDDHGMADGQVVKVGEPFQVGGYSMMFPGDMSHGAPIKQVANCRCTTVPFLRGDVVQRVPA
jgi:HK97 family phage portal protein